MLNTVNQLRQKGEEVSVPDMAASFEWRITEILAEKLLCAAKDTNAKQICIAGGVAANRALREKLEHGAQSLKATLYLPDLSLCGDNAAMIAAQGFYEYSAKPAAHWDDYALNGVPSLPIDYE